MLATVTIILIIIGECPRKFWKKLNTFLDTRHIVLTIHIALRKKLKCRTTISCLTNKNIIKTDVISFNIMLSIYGI